jgi:hypothetical protein
MLPATNDWLSMDWIYQLSVFQILLAVLLIIFVATRVSFYTQGISEPSDKEWVEPFLGVIGVMSTVLFAVPSAWQCLGGGICPENPYPACASYFILSIYFAVRALQNVFRGKTD